MTEPPLSADAWLLVAGLCWVLMSLVVSSLGWAQLAAAYPRQPGDDGFTGRRLRFQSGGFAGGAGYNWTLGVGVGEAGLRLTVWPLLRIGHPPIFVPWEDVSAREIRAGLVRRVELRFRLAPRVGLRVTPKLAGRLAELSPLRVEPPATA